MSNNNESPIERRRRIGTQFDRPEDPLEQYHEDFVEMEADGIDPFELFLDEIIRNSGRKDSTVSEYERAIRHFKAVVSEAGRHPVCANDAHVQIFVQDEFDERDNGTATIKTKLTHVRKAYHYFQAENVFPHSTDYNPIDAAWEKIAWPEAEEEKEFPEVTREEMRVALADITHAFKLAVIFLGVKLGMRQGEIRNVQLRDIHIENSELQAHYPELGSHRRLNDFTNAIFIPSKFNREGNKSKRPRVLPLDEELRRVLTQYLLIRPDCGEPWVFLSQTQHERIRDKDGINRHWREQMRPHFPAAEHEDEVTSHFGRHWFTTYWKLEIGMEKEYVQFMRGDKIGDGKDSEPINAYLHAYYSDIEDRYRDEIYKLL